jgi:mannitol/fructose-specific phosphotransferase system IIA component (Ntr-type)
VWHRFDAVFAANVICKLRLGCWRICAEATIYIVAKTVDATFISSKNQRRFLRLHPESPSPVAAGRASDSRPMQLRERVCTDLSDSVAGFTNPALIVPELREQDSPGIIKELSHVLHANGCVPDVLTFYNAVLNHEFLVDSVTESGVALPHARLTAVDRPQFAFGRNPHPVVWWRKGPNPVQFVFLFAVPATEASEFLQILAALAKLGRQPDMLEALRGQESALGIFELLKQLKLRQR